MVDREQLSKRLNEAYQLLLDKGCIHSKTDLAKAVNKDRAAISNALANKGRVMTEGLMNRVADAFPYILNREYLINGTGSIALPDKKSRPHIADMQTAAGFLDGISESQYATNRELAQMVPDYDFTIRAAGNSMEPEIKSGDILCCRIVSDRFYIPLNHICVFDTAEGALVKQLIRAEPGQLLLHSLNPKYPDITLPTETLQGIATVVGILRSTTHPFPN